MFNWFCKAVLLQSCKINIWKRLKSTKNQTRFYSSGRRDSPSISFFYRWLARLTFTMTDGSEAIKQPKRFLLRHFTMCFIISANVQTVSWVFPLYSLQVPIGGTITVPACSPEPVRLCVCVRANKCVCVCVCKAVAVAEAVSYFSVPESCTIPGPLPAPGYIRAGLFFFFSWNSASPPMCDLQL